MDRSNSASKMKFRLCDHDKQFHVYVYRCMYVCMCIPHTHTHTQIKSGSLQLVSFSRLRSVQLSAS